MKIVREDTECLVLQTGPATGLLLGACMLLGSIALGWFIKGDIATRGIFRDLRGIVLVLMNFFGGLGFLGSAGVRRYRFDRAKSNFTENAITILGRRQAEFPISCVTTIRVAAFMGKIGYEYRLEMLGRDGSVLALKNEWPSIKDFSKACDLATRIHDFLCLEVPCELQEVPAGLEVVQASNRAGG